MSTNRPQDVNAQDQRLTAGVITAISGFVLVAISVVVPIIAWTGLGDKVGTNVAAVISPVATLVGTVVGAIMGVQVGQKGKQEADQRANKAESKVQQLAHA